MKYEQIGEFRLNWKWIITLNLIAGVIFFVGFNLFFYVYITCSSDQYCERLLHHSNIGVLYGLIFIQIILHEYSHGIGYRLFGGKVTYGIKWLSPYCREVSGKYYSQGKFIFTLILPLILGTIVGIWIIILFPQFLYYVIICILFNISGSTGDLAMLGFVLLKLKKGEYIKDEPYGFSIHRLQIS